MFIIYPQRSLPALRQMTPDSEAFIQQSLLPQTSTPTAAAASTALTAVVLRPPLSTATTMATSTASTKTTVISLTQPPHSKPGLVIKAIKLSPLSEVAVLVLHIRNYICVFGHSFILLFPFLCVQRVPQQQGTLVRPQGTIARPQVTLAQPSMVTLRGPTHSHIIVGQLPTGVCLIIPVSTTK